MWEYRLVSLFVNDDNEIRAFPDTIESLGLIGWEAVGPIEFRKPTHGGVVTAAGLYLLFKRRK